MNTYKLILLAISFAALFACKKEYQGETTVYGHVYTKGTTNFPGDTAIKMCVDVEIPGGIGSGGAWDCVYEFYTNNQGYYNYTFTANEFNDYRVRVAKGVANHWPPFDYCFAYIANGSRQNLNLELAPHAYLQLHVRNKINPQLWDYIAINWGGGQSSRFYADFDDTVQRVQWGNSYNRITATFFRGGVNYEGGNAYPLHDTIFLPAFDTTYYLIDIDF